MIPELKLLQKGKENSNPEVILIYSVSMHTYI